MTVHLLIALAWTIGSIISGLVFRNMKDQVAPNFAVWYVFLVTAIAT